MTLSATDTLVLADVDNQTNDPVLDDALNAALRLELEQTPYVDVLDVDKEYAALTALKLPKTTKLTSDVARQICLKTNSRMVISASIADAGNRYRLGIRALGCESGTIEVEEYDNINSRNELVHELGVAGARFRARLGEPADSLARSISRRRRRSALHSRRCRIAFRAASSISRATQMERSNSFNKPQKRIPTSPSRMNTWA